MSKIRKILTTGAVALGMLSGPGAAMLTTGVVDATADIPELQENVDDDIFHVMSMDSNAGMLRMSFTMPEGMEMKRMVVARPGEDKYRLIPELDTLAMRMLDGEAGEEVDGLLMTEVGNLKMQISGREFYGWVGFSIYDSMETGLRILEKNPADVIYVGVELENVTTGEESRYYYKVDYRSCAHQKNIIDWWTTMCVAESENGKFRLVPEDGLPLNDVPTWEEELATLMQKAVKEYFDDLSVVETMRDEGEEISLGQIEELEGKQEKLNTELAKYPEITGGRAFKTDFETRLATLKRAVVGDQESQTGNQGNQGSSAVLPGVASGTGSGETGSTSIIAGSSMGVVTDLTAETTVKTPVVATGAAEVDATAPAEVDKTEAEVVATKESEDIEQIEVEIPKLGGSWVERYGLAIMIAGASFAGVVGWFLIGVIGKKHKHNKR